MATKREMLTVIAAGETNEEVMAWAAGEIAKLNAANEKRRNTVSKKAQENAPLIDRIVNEILGDEPMTATDVHTELGVSVQKASSLLRAAVKEGRANVEDVKVKGKGTQKGYTVA